MAILPQPVSEESDIFVRLIPPFCNPSPAIDPLAEIGIVDGNMEGVKPVHDLAHQVTHLIVVEVGGIIPCNLAPIAINNSNIGIVPDMGDWDYARMEGFEAGVHIIASVLAIMAAMRFSSAAFIGQL